MTQQPQPVEEALRALPDAPLPADVDVDTLRKARLALALAAPPPPPQGVMGWVYAAGIPLVLVTAGLAHVVMSVVTMVKVWG